ncbi:MAG: tRNA (adenosine(37)-N6)-threonylcarbamoyltransferase complex transferase subunit TsaD [candidate division WOR-3 bacterium]
MRSICLGIETSCDETSVSVVADGKEILSNIVSSQSIHSIYGGVVPELAARAHLPLIVPITETALAVAKVDYKDLNLIAATYAPGLIGALLVGFSFAKALALGLSIPFVAVNHLEGHIFAVLLEYPNIEFPFISLIISGGHTELILVKDHCDYTILGTTLDDACGEAFDKVAKMLGLPYPGGHFIERLAEKGNRTIKFPIPQIENYDFSFSGLKTAVLYYLRDTQDPKKEDIACSFQEVVFDFLLNKIEKAVVATGIRRVAISGGVAVNKRLRERVKTFADKNQITCFLPKSELCTDNAAMIAAAGYSRYQHFGASPLTTPALARAKL